jgi:hypothetical protein
MGNSKQVWLRIAVLSVTVFFQSPFTWAAGPQPSDYFRCKDALWNAGSDIYGGQSRTSPSPKQLYRADVSPDEHSVYFFGADNSVLSVPLMGVSAVPCVDSAEDPSCHQKHGRTDYIKASFSAKDEKGRTKTYYALVRIKSGIDTDDSDDSHAPIRYRDVSVIIRDQLNQKPGPSASLHSLDAWNAYDGDYTQVTPSKYHSPNDQNWGDSSRQQLEKETQAAVSIFASQCQSWALDKDYTNGKAVKGICGRALDQCKGLAGAYEDLSGSVAKAAKDITNMTDPAPVGSHQNGGSQGARQSGSASDNQDQ